MNVNKYVKMKTPKWSPPVIVAVMAETRWMYSYEIRGWVVAAYRLPRERYQIGGKIAVIRRDVQYRSCTAFIASALFIHATRC